MNSRVALATLLLGMLFIMSGCTTTPEKQPPDGAVALQSFTQEDAERLLIPGQTRQHQALQWFGQPNGVSQSGKLTYWNFTHAYHNKGAQRSGLISLTLVFNELSLLVDYDLQSNRYRHE